MRGHGEEARLVAAPQLFPPLALIKLFGLDLGVEPDRFIAAPGAHAAPGPSQTPFLKEAGLQRQGVKTIAVAGGVDQIQVQRQRHGVGSGSAQRDGAVNGEGRLASLPAPSPRLFGLGFALRFGLRLCLG